MGLQKKKLLRNKFIWWNITQPLKRNNAICSNKGGPAAAAAAKLLQSCLTLCDPRDGSPPGSPVSGILQARTVEWVAISFSNAKMGTIKDRNGMDLTEVKDIKKKWQEYTEKLYKKGLHDPDNHNGVITHLQPGV